MTITIGEKYFFEEIKSQCEIIFDIGAREDIFYYESHPFAQYHLFEPNPVSFENLKNKIDAKIDAKNVILNNFGLGRNTKPTIIIQIRSHL